MTRFLQSCLLAICLLSHSIFAAEIPHANPAEVGMSAERLGKFSPRCRLWSIPGNSRAF